MSLPTNTLARILAFAAGPIAVVAAGAMVFQGSYAAFEAETRVSGNSWTTGQVTLDNDSNGVAAFHVNNMVPGATATKCIVVTSTAGVPGVVKTYMVNPTSTPSATAVEHYITMTIDIGTGGSFSGGCSGFTSSSQLFTGTLDDLVTLHGNWTDALGSWAVTSGSATYRFVYTFSSSAPSSVMNQSFGVDFEWEMQNT